jgi:GAF domain-containing protein
MTMQRPSPLEQSQELAKMLEAADLDETLVAITRAAVQLIPDVDYASITVRHGAQGLETVQATDDAVRALDELQYALREGPCYEAGTDRAHVVAPDLANDERFPTYGPEAVAAGFRSQAAFRLFERGDTQGALNVYSARVGAFTDLDDFAGLFQSHAAVAVAYAYEVTNLQEALSTRTTIGKAVGILMERFQLNDERAFAFLTRLSQNRNVKLRLIAEELVDEAADRAELTRES